MKILRLELKAFGPFTDRTLDLSAGREGLHIVFGLNEAGKSTALRALEQLFFGIPDRSRDDFIHASLSMRLGATLRHSDGSKLSFWRRKARKIPLFEEDDRTPLDPARLLRFLGHLDQGLFSSMFGLNRTTLAEAGQEMVRGGGQLGQILFAAASGIASLREVQNRLEKELDELFKPTGRLPRINREFTELREVRDRLRQHQLPSEDWLQRDHELRQTELQRQQVQQQFESIVREERRLSRLRDALPVLARRREVLTALELVRSAPALANDFVDRRKGAQALLSSAMWKMQQAQQALEEVERQLGSLEVPLEILSRAEAIEDLHRRLGEHQNALRELPQRRQQHQTKQAEVQSLWQKLGRTDEVAQAEKLRLRAEEAAQVRTLALEHQSLRANLQNAQSSVERLTKFVDQTRQALERLATPLEVSALRKAVRQAQLQGPLEEEWTNLTHRAEQSDRHTRRMFEQLAGYSGSLEELLALTVPAADVLDRYHEALQESQTRHQDLERKVQSGETELKRLDEQLRLLEQDGHLPTEQDLRTAREDRDSQWQKIRRALQEPNAKVLSELMPAFEKSIHATDEIADRLRTEADRVARKTELTTQIEQMQQRQAKLREDQAQAQSQAQKTQQEWHAQLQALKIAPQTPREMRAWVARYQGIVQQAGQGRELRQRADALRTRLDQQCRLLEESLEKTQASPDPLLRSLTFLLDMAQQIIDQQDSLVRKRQDLERDLASKKQELDQARLDLDQMREQWKRWQSRWTAAMQRLGLDPTTPAEAATAYLESLQELFSKLQDLANLQTRIDTLQHDVEAYARDVDSLRRWLPSLRALQGDLDPAQAVVEMHQRLKKAREAQQRQSSLLENRQQLLTQMQQIQQTQALQEKVLQDLCGQAGCEKPEDLPAVEERAHRRKELERALAQTDQHLQALRDGVPLEEFIRQVSQMPVERLEADLTNHSRLRENLGTQLKEIDQLIGRQRKVLADMDGSARAADDAEQEEFLLAQLQADSREYAVRRLALGILQESIERFRHKSEGKVVNRASHLFKLLTLDHFEGLNLDSNENGEAVLTGVRAGDRQMVLLDGMSDGTRDQLFLALRLASLEVYLETHEPIPFVVDDLLLNFDDARSLAALQALMQLSRYTQVLFFTHHQHLVELARKSFAPDEVFFHALPEWKKDMPRQTIPDEESDSLEVAER